MLLDMETAKILASIIFVSTQGTESLTRQLPLQIVDRGESWLVKGTPYTDASIDSKNIAQYIFIKKAPAR